MVTMKSLLLLYGSTDTLSSRHEGNACPELQCMFRKILSQSETRRFRPRISLTYGTKKLRKRRSISVMNHPCATGPMFCILDNLTLRSRTLPNPDGRCILSSKYQQAAYVPDAILRPFLSAIPEKNILFEVVHLMERHTKCYSSAFPPCNILKKKILF